MPRISIAIDDDEDSLLSPPPRLSVPLDEGMQTQRSVENPRRAYSEQPFGRLSRGSFGSLRISDRFADLHETGLEGLSYNSHDVVHLQGQEGEVEPEYGNGMDFA